MSEESQEFDEQLIKENLDERMKRGNSPSAIKQLNQRRINK